jgi:hypothetical protein
MQNIISPFRFNAFTKIYMNRQGFPFQQRSCCQFAQQQGFLCPGLLPVPAFVQTLSGIGAPNILLDSNNLATTKGLNSVQKETVA